MRHPRDVKINDIALTTILENHKDWISEYGEDWESKKADLNYANLLHVDLGAVNLCDADLHGADLSCANLDNAYLRHADLHEADLFNANLCNVDLCYANLCNAKLRKTNLNYANLYGADLNGVKLDCANLYGADLREAKNVPYIPLACPSEGAFIGWKKCRNYLIKLEIPEDAKRSSATTRKCRCDKAKVLGIYHIDGSEANIDYVESWAYEYIKYEIGEMAYPDYFDEDRWNECSHGIHFFVNKQDAIDYNFF